MIDFVAGFLSAWFLRSLLEWMLNRRGGNIGVTPFVRNEGRTSPPPAPAHWRPCLMTNLSPATQAIIDASNCAGSRIVQLHIADAFRALAARINGADAIRQDVLDIADELEA